MPFDPLAKASLYAVKRYDKRKDIDFSHLVYSFSLLHMKLIVAYLAYSLVILRTSAYLLEKCIQTYKVSANESCMSIISKFKLTDTQFYNMNPGLHHSARHPAEVKHFSSPVSNSTSAPSSSSLLSQASAKVTSSSTVTPLQPTARQENSVRSRLFTSFGFNSLDTSSKVVSNAAIGFACLIIIFFFA
ncbi:hypothetical protein BY458DRAFT_491543 [Sporodiniella umbellata]|nr:hypothetical protein BY458DRAFT_491543 [Sporodiniella umbellata]